MAVMMGLLMRLYAPCFGYVLSGSVHVLNACFARKTLVNTAFGGP